MLELDSKVIINKTLQNECLLSNEKIYKRNSENQLPNYLLKEKIENAIYLLDIAITNDQFSLKSNDNLINELRLVLPYCIHETRNDDIYIVVNRKYSPIGIDCGWVVYEEIKSHQINLTKIELDSLNLNSENTFWRGSSDSPIAKLENAMKYRNKLIILIRLLEKQ
jgi:hypothetical protein